MKIKREHYPEIKTNLITEYQDLVKEAKAAYLINFKGTNVEKITNFRKALDANGDRLKVLKNRLAKVAFANTGYKGLTTYLTQDNALVVCNQDVVATAKVITKEIDETETIKLVRAIFADNAEEILTFKEVKQISTLPSREELLAKLLNVLNASATNFVRTLNEPIASFARLVNTLAQQKEQS